MGVIRRHRQEARGRTHQEDKEVQRSLQCWCCLSPWVLQLSSPLACEAARRWLCSLLRPEGQKQCKDNFDIFHNSQSIFTVLLSIQTVLFGTLALRRTNRTWSGSVCALQCRASVKYWCWNKKNEELDLGTVHLKVCLNNLYTSLQTQPWRGVYREEHCADGRT